MIENRESIAEPASIRRPMHDRPANEAVLTAIKRHPEVLQKMHEATMVAGVEWEERDREEMPNVGCIHSRCIVGQLTA